MESFPSFYSRYHPLLLGVAQQRLVGLSSAEDVVAEAFAIAWSHLRDGHELTLPWMYQVLRNLIGNEYQRAVRAGQLTERVGASLGSNVVEFAGDESVELRMLIRALPEDDRELMYMAYWEDLSRNELAAILGCSSTAVRLRLMRAKRRLRALVEARYPGTGKEGTNG